MHDLILKHSIRRKKCPSFWFAILVSQGHCSIDSKLANGKSLFQQRSEKVLQKWMPDINFFIHDRYIRIDWMVTTSQHIHNELFFPNNHQLLIIHHVNTHAFSVFIDHIYIHSNVISISKDTGCECESKTLTCYPETEQP